MTEKEEYAKEVYDTVKGLIDRTLEKHRYPIDVDVRKPDAPPEKRIWIYWGSARNIEQAEEKIEDAKEELLENLGENVQVRIVESKTGRVLKKLEKMI